MKNDAAILCEKQGVWYFRGEPLRMGGPISIDGVMWVVLRVDRARSESQEPYLWIRNEWYGTTVYAPSSRHLTAPQPVLDRGGAVIPSTHGMTAA